MVVSSSTVAERVVGSTVYKEMLADLIEATGVEVESEYAEVFARLDSAKIVRARFDAEGVIAVLLSNEDAIRQYSIRKFDSVFDVEGDEDYPAGSIPTEDEKGKTLSVGRYSQGFLLTNIIEYGLAVAGRDQLLKYVKLSNIPKAKKYTDQIMEMVKLERAS